MYAIDSLRQLGMKYLERAELANFTFQNDILKPFVILMRNSRNETIRSLIVDCIVQMIKSKVGSIKSGWRSVFMIFTAAADDEIESIVDSAFENVEQVILEHFDQVVGDCFMDCVNCLIGFANNKSAPRISLKAIALLRICEDRLAEGLIPGGALKPVDSDLETNFDVTEHYWFPMLAGLSDLTLDSRAEVRNCALEVLFDLLNERGHKFSSAFWESIFHRVLFPIFDHVRHAGRDGILSSGDEWLRETSIHSLQLLCNLFNTFYKEVSFMLPPLLGLLLDCAKKTDQTVVSISLGALVHLIEVGGHQFSDNDWDTLLKGIRDASYTTQPLELLNSLGFEMPSNKKSQNANGSDSISFKDIHHDINNGGRVVGQASFASDSETSGRNLNSDNLQKDDQNSKIQTNLEESEGSTQKNRDAGNSQQSQTFGQRFMGNMMDNLLLRTLTSKSKSHSEEVLVPSSPVKILDTDESSTNSDEENPSMQTVRGKCITQLLLLGVINSIQLKYWSKLNISQKITIMDILLSLLEFAASYNSTSNLRMRMQQVPSERPPLNLLRQEIEGTSIYLDILHKTTSTHDSNSDEHLKDNGPVAVAVSSSDTTHAESTNSDRKLKSLAEEKLVAFCEHILKDASDLQPVTGEAASADIHQVLDLRAPVIVKVLKTMCRMERQIFRKHLREFYPLITKLVCCDQKLIAYDHLEGDPGLEGGKSDPLFTDILNMICGCVDNSSSDSTILQVLKVLLTAVASTRFRVHGEPLLAVIRVCYNIALNSKSPINQATSKAMLTQMISIVFRRMESDQVVVSSDSHANTHIASASCMNSDNGEITIADQDEQGITLGDALSMSGGKDTSLASVEELQNLAGGADIRGLEAVLDKAVHLEDGKKISRGIDLESMSVAQRDALLLFRTLCKMGMKEENDEVTVKTRLLSLELLQGLLEGVNQSFTKNFHFIDSVKAYLSYALLRASVSSSPIVFQHATGIFIVLLQRFRESLKGEIGVFFPLIILRSLDSSDSPLNQRTSVLRLLEKVFKDPQMLVDIFVNYDCDLEAPNLFERMVNALSRIAQGTQSIDPTSTTSSQITSVKGSSLQCLVSVLKSLVDWEKLRRVFRKHGSIVQSLEEEVLDRELHAADELKNRDDVSNQFEKAKAHKSTMEAAISEMEGLEFVHIMGMHAQMNRPRLRPGIHISSNFLHH